ncbi:MAG: hypothetical protein R6X29_00625 [Acidimicrobiia bacterium]|jgi:hypothetical protein
MRKTMIMMTLVLALVAGACAAEVTESDEYQALENELVAVEQQLSDTVAQLEAATANQDTSNAESASSSARRDLALEGLAMMKKILDDPESIGTEDEVVNLLASYAADGTVMDDDVFGAVPYRQAWHNTLYGGAFDARIDIYDYWVSEDGSQGGVLWIWHGLNAKGNPFELPGISLTEFDEDGLIAYELVTYPYPDDYVQVAVLGNGSPTPSTG